MSTFEELELTDHVLRSLREMGFEEPTPVQARAIPPLMAGKDVVAQALTGTGKTAAFGIPLTEHLDPRFNHPQAIVLAPTRELAVQVSEHLTMLSKYRGLRFLAIYGGQPIERQLHALRRGVHGIVATPGRLMDHMRRGTVDLSQIRMLVLDEADQMLNMGFQEDVEYITGHLPPEKLTALFSATMPKPILDIVHRYMKNPEMVMLSGPRELTVPAVEQIYYQVPFPRKFDALCRVMDARASEKVLVFCATKRMVDEVSERLPAHGYAAEALHGDVSQAGREKVLRAFREGRTEVLVATDVAARGLDINDVGLVVNFDIPPDPEYYVHRIGRTARSGRNGAAITFVNPREMRELQMIERATGAHIRRAELPTNVEIEERESDLLETRLRESLERGTWKRFRGVVEGLATEHDAADIAAAAIALVVEGRFAGKKPAPAAAAPRFEQRAPVERPAQNDGPPREFRPDNRNFRRDDNTGPRQDNGGWRRDDNAPRRDDGPGREYSSPRRADASPTRPGDYPKRRAATAGGPPAAPKTRFKPRTFRGAGASKPGGKAPYKGKR